MAYAQPIHLLASSGYVGQGIGLPVLVGRNSMLDLLLVVSDAPDDAIVSVTVETSAFAVRENSAAHSITWRKLGSTVELVGTSSTLIQLVGCDAFVRARYDVAPGPSASAVALSFGGRASCILAASAVRSSVGVGAAIDLDQYHGGRFSALVSAVPGGLETLALTIERSSDGQSGWTTAATFPTISAVGEYAVESADLDRFVRLRWAPSGAGSWTFGVSGTASLIFSRTRDRALLGIRNAAIPNATAPQYLAAFEAASDIIAGDLGAFVLPLRQWGSDMRQACTALADWHLLCARGEPPANSIYRDSFTQWSGWLADVGGRVPGAAGRRIRPANVIDSSPPERDGTRAAYKFASDPPRDGRSRRVVW